MRGKFEKKNAHDGGGEGVEERLLELKRALLALLRGRRARTNHLLLLPLPDAGGGGGRAIAEELPLAVVRGTVVERRGRYRGVRRRLALRRHRGVRWGRSLR